MLDSNVGYQHWISGISVAVLCQLGTVTGCGGNASDTTKGGDGDGQGDGDAGGDGDFQGDGDTGGDGDLQGDGDDMVQCGDIAWAVASFVIEGAPIVDGICAVSLEVSGDDQERFIECYASADVCSCLMWSGTLVEGTHVVRVLDADGVVRVSHSGPYPPAQNNGPCGGPLYETIVMEYVNPTPPDQVSCAREGVVEYCAPGETCCTCGCGEPTEGCLDEVACPPHAGPTCGDATCREGMSCCPGTESACATSVADCPG